MNEQYTYNPVIWPSIFTIILMTVLAVHAWRRHNSPGALWFVIYCLVGVAYLVAKVTEFLAVDIETKIFWFKVGYPWLLPGTTALICFILEYAWPGRWITRRTLIPLFTAPIVGLVFTLSNDFHNLFFRAYDFNGDIVPLYGPAGWGLVVYDLGLGAVSILTLGWLSIRSPQHRLPAILILMGVIVVSLVLVLHPHLEESQFFYVPEKAIPVVACAIALFGYQIFDPISLARQTVIEQLQAAMLVLDLEGRVIKLNPAAERILNIHTKQVKGKMVKELLPAIPEKFLVDSAHPEIELCIGEGLGLRYYVLRIWPLNDFRGLTVGVLLLLTDVTEQKRAQTQILEQQRSIAMLHEREQLARELHDNLGQVFAFFNVQGQTIHHLLCRGDLSAAQENVSRLVEVALEADVDIRESIMNLRATVSEHGLLPTLTQYLAKYEKNFGIRTLLVGAETCTDGAFEPMVEAQLLRILKEALTNVRKHANARKVQITFVLEDGWACITIRDDGQGFDPDVSSAGREEHVGLRLMRERAEEAGGTLGLNSALGQGTELTVHIPLKGANHARFFAS